MAIRALVATCVTAALLGWSMGGQASPLEGAKVFTGKIPGGQVPTFKEKFKGGERACVIVIGDHNPVVPLHLKVQDAKGNLIGEDKNGGDYCAVIWYPPRDGVYIISVAVPHIGGDADWNKLYIAVK